MAEKEKTAKSQHRFTLYYKPGACSLATNIILAQAQAETGLEYGLEKVDTAAHKLENGEDYYKINPRGAVPALEIPHEGKKVIITQNFAILSYVGDHSGIKAFSPEKGSLKRARLNEALGFCGDLHGAYSNLHPARAANWDDKTRKIFLDAAGKRLQQLEDWLPKDSKSWWIGDEFTQADAYVAVILSWSPNFGIDLAPYPKARAFKDRVFALPAAKKAVELENGK